WHRCAGGGAVHSINNGSRSLRELPKKSRPEAALNSNLMIEYHAAIIAGFDFRRFKSTMFVEHARASMAHGSTMMNSVMIVMMVVKASHPSSRGAGKGG
ncbi:MAG: hypothetical protein WBV83_25620, partial [Bradyrhizobium sp.]|uniref:hypothetical protein n=2 Tax=Bradyrhizobium sp. TaxID=376 RepID=UPI003C4E0582